VSGLVMSAEYSASQTAGPKDFSFFYKASLTALVVSSWISGILFALYITGFYLIAHTKPEVEAWNDVLPQLYSPNEPAAMTGMISHFFTGAILLFFGPIQFSTWLRKNYSYIHRWIGVSYTFAGFITGFGGLVFMLILGAAGGITMLIGFGIYGFLMMVASVQTLRYAMRREFNTHREWAIRLFALGLGSWLYRIGYGFAFSTTGTTGMGINYSGPLDYFMDFAFFVIPLIVAEMVIQGKRSSVYSLWKAYGGVAALAATVAIWWSTAYWMTLSWKDSILKLI
jgi:hypothetical protein